MSAATAGDWRVRHEGSNRTIDGLTPEEIVAGLHNGQWEPTDEVLGPSDAGWTALEEHARFAEIAAEIEPEKPRTYDDQTHLDMNPLIDVCLVLLVFFILTTSYAALQKRLEAPDPAEEQKEVKVLKMTDVKEQMIQLTVTLADGQPVYKLEEEIVSADDLPTALSRAVGKTAKTKLLLAHEREVTHGALVRAHDAAKGAGIRDINLVVPKR